VLWDGKLVARIDCKTERKESLLYIQHLVLESSLAKTDEFHLALANELWSFLRFNNCSNIRLNRTSPTNIKPALQAVLTGMTHCVTFRATQFVRCCGALS
jgi:uncharacterized protein YcaQ